MHIILRFELEQEIIGGRVALADLPEEWNRRMWDYLGIEVPDDAHGVLQDVHWSGGSMGYFPTYSLGNVLSAQLYDKAVADVPSIPSDIESGTFEPLLTWLRENVHRHGRKFEPPDLIRRVTGQELTTGPYVRYLKSKFGEIYGV